MILDGRAEIEFDNGAYGAEMRRKMTRAEYLSKLQEQLEKFGNELQQEIMEDYSQHFAEGEAAGRTDDDIIEELGNIEDMIRELKSVEVQPDESIRNAAQTQDEQGCGEDHNAAQSEAGTDGQNGEAEQLSVPNDEARKGAFKGVVLKTGVADIVLVQSEDDAVHVDYRNDGSMEDKLKYEFYQYEKDGIFYAGVRRNKNYNDGKQRSFSIGPTTITFHNNFNVGSRNENIILIARVPKQIPEVKTETSSGNIEAGKLAVTKLKSVTASGDVKISESVLEKLEATTASGDIEIENVTVEKQDCTTASGDIQLKGIKSCKTGLVTASGDVACREMTSEKIDVKTASGDVDVKADAGQYHLITASGDVELQTAMAPERVEVTTASGDINLVLQAVEGAEVKTNSRSGDISLNQKGNKIDARSGNVYTFGDGACKVSAVTVSGDIAIRL